MVILGPTNAIKEDVKKVAFQQYGYFTAQQALLSFSAIESNGCFMVIRLGQTLSDMRDELEKNDQWVVL